MSLPGDIATIVLTGTYLDLYGNPRTGTVSFAPTTPILVDAGSETILAGEQTAALSSGQFSVTLPCTDGLAPSGWLWQVTENVSGVAQRVYAIALPSALGLAVDISALTPVFPVRPPNWALLASQLGVANGAAQLDSGGVLPPSQGGTGTYPGGTTEYLRADGTWDVPAGGGGAVPSVFGRTGAITAQAGDYTVSQVTGAAPLASPALTGTPTAPAPTASTQIANKAYVDSVAAGLDPKPSVTALAATSITLSGAQTIDGVSVTAGERVLCTAQSTASQNGLWTAASGAWSRPADFASASSQSGSYTFVQAGTDFGGSGWVLVGAVTVDTSAETWTQYSSAADVNAGAGLSMSGSVISLETPVTLADGGTGATTATAALAALGGLPAPASGPSATGLVPVVTTVSPLALGWGAGGGGSGTVDWQNVKSYGAHGDGVIHTDGAVSASSATFTSYTATFTSGDVGKLIVIAGIPGPAFPFLTPAATGGTVAAGVYQAVITYVNASGETTASAHSQVTTTTATSAIAIASPAAYGNATGWYAYVTQPGGSVFYRQQTSGSPTAIGTSLILTAPPTTSGANPPGSNTAGTALSTTISAYVNSHTVTLAASATAGVSGVPYAYGTDDTAAVQAAVSACSATAGGTVYAPAGIYMTSAAITLPYLVTLRGAGQGGVYASSSTPGPNGAVRGTTVIQQTSLTANALETTSGEISELNVTDLVLQGPWQCGTGAGLSIPTGGGSNQSTTVIIERVMANAFGGHGFALNRLNFAALRDCQAWANGGDGFNVNGAPGVEWSNCHAFDNTGNGFTIQGLNGQLSELYTNQNCGYGIYLYNASGWSMAGCTYEEDALGGIYLTNCQAFSLTGNQVSLNLLNALTITANCYNFVVSGFFETHGGSGVNSVFASSGSIGTYLGIDCVDPASIPTGFSTYLNSGASGSNVSLSLGAAASASVFAPRGITGSTAPSRYVGATHGGPPATGTFALGDFTVDLTGGMWVCISAPGTWAQVGAGGGGLSPVFSAETASGQQGQYQLAATITITAQYSDLATELHVLANDSGTATASSATIHWHAKQQLALGSPPYVMLLVDEGIQLTPADFTSVVTLNSGTQTVVELWIQAPVNFETYNFYEIATTAGGAAPSLTFPANSSTWSSSLPSGAQLTGAPGPSYPAAFGDGSDGAVVLDGTTSYGGFASLSGSVYTLTRDVFATSLTVNPGVTLQTPGAYAARVLATQGIGGSGTISADGSDATGSSGAAGGGGFAGGGSGGSGATGAGGTGAGSISNRFLTGSSGAGGNGPSGSGAAAGTSSWGAATYKSLFRAMPALMTGAVSAGGSVRAPDAAPGGGGGAGDGTNPGGGGGGGGGVLVIAAPSIAPGVTLSADGGDGYTPTAGNAGGGGGGAGGFIAAYTLTPFSGASSVAGGSGGSGPGTGTNGGNGTAGTFLNVIV